MAQFPPTQTVHYLLLNLIGVAQLLNLLHLAEVAELADAPDSKSGARKGVRVRVPPSVLRCNAVSERVSADVGHITLDDSTASLEHAEGTSPGLAGVSN